ncbi:MAG TPA: purine-nucleoside phosphorylase [Planctomycetia bacterium]|nr:purine-nucleoside phosphorylase [Planctomycetia bacterium]
MLGLFEQIETSLAAVRNQWRGAPRAGIILGTGLGGLAEEIEAEATIHYADLPNFPVSTVESHRGQLVCGKLAGVPVVAMEGRFHFYEGYSMQEITFPVRLMKAMGCETLVVSNACGGLNPQYRNGDIMLIEDHVNLMGDNPLVGKNDDRLGVRFPDMCEPYDKALLARARAIAVKERIPVQQGVYVAVTGPNLETRAEYRFLKAIGADVVGMSTVPEAIVAKHANMKVVGFSVITDMCLPDHLEPVEISKILATAKGAEPHLRTLVREIVRSLGD